MGFIAALISTALCAVVYVRMYKRELPEPMGKRKAAVPVAFGVVSVLLSTALVIAFGFGIRATVGSVAEAVSNPVLSSLVSSFLLAGFTEELVKFLVFLLTLKICKPKSVYEYGMLCAGVGFGFTGLEAMLYGGQAPAASFLRILFFAMHMVFGLLMGLHWGLARYAKKQGNPGAGKHTFLAGFLPVLWHTVFDAFTTVNPALRFDDDTVKIAGIVAAGVVLAVSIALQALLLIRFRKNAETYCGMLLTEPAVE
ncbi:MAG: PrsW family intramembrane metalloprotease [Oscillospiraceae bacterium]|nr:PrsW family intramembrane metalloprotease [Oscillospiraceae bacterium]MBO5638835.1 PrsW family intramembrane metalloprotease [Oscillospiraceae bacterium]